MLQRRSLVALSLGAGLASRGAGAQAPEGPTTIVVPFTPGTGVDILARLVAPFLQNRFAQPFIVENRPGASGNIGTQAVARAAPDGRTLLLQANTFVMNASLFKQVPYDPVGSFAPIVRLTRGDLVLAVHPGTPAADAKAFAELARARSLDYASPGNGTPQHLGMELFRLVAGISLNHIPYRGSAPAIQDLLGGRVQPAAHGPPALRPRRAAATTPGSRITYTLTYTNAGSQDATGVVVTGFVAAQPDTVFNFSEKDYLDGK